MDKAGSVTVVHTFTGPDGSRPRSALVQGADGALYGSTVVGGTFGLGVLFHIDTTTPAPTPPPKLTGLTLAPPSVAGGQISTGTVTLSGPAPSGSTAATLSSGNSSIVSVPATVIVPAGASSASFPASTKRVKRATAVTIKAAYNGMSVSATLTVTR
jgi:uncharacterized repeat protein (TIGR03803 family)